MKEKKGEDEPGAEQSAQTWLPEIFNKDFNLTRFWSDSLTVRVEMNFDVAKRELEEAVNESENDGSCGVDEGSWLYILSLAILM